MENLKAALSEVTSTHADEIIDRMCQQARKEDEWFNEEPYEIYEFVGEAARSLMGYRHGSDFYDAHQYDVSGEYSDVYERDLSDVKDAFGADFINKLEKDSLQGITGFDELYKLAKRSGFDGDAGAFETVLKKSALFADYALRLVTRYDG
jgi:hypothetical protein